MDIPDIPLGPEIEQAQVGGDEQHIHHGLENTEDKHPVVLGLLQLPAALQEIIQFPLLPVENLGNLHT